MLHVGWIISRVEPNFCVNLTPLREKKSKFCCNHPKIMRSEREVSGSVQKAARSERKCAQNQNAHSEMGSENPLRDVLGAAESQYR